MYISNEICNGYKILNGSFTPLLFQILPFEVTAQFHSFIAQGLFQMAISRYVSLPEKKDMLFQMLQWMPGQGYVADSATRNLILKNSHLFGRQQIAEILSKQHMISKASKSREKEKRV